MCCWGIWICNIRTRIFLLYCSTSCRWMIECSCYWKRAIRVGLGLLLMSSIGWRPTRSLSSILSGWCCIRTCHSGTFFFHVTRLRRFIHSPVAGHKDLRDSTMTIDRCFSKATMFLDTNYHKFPINLWLVTFVFFVRICCRYRGLFCVSRVRRIVR